MVEHTFTLFRIFCLQIGYHSLSKPIPKGFFSHVFQQFQQLNQAKWQKLGEGENECLKDLITFKTSTVFPRRLYTLLNVRIVYTYFPREALNEMLCPQTIGPSIFDEVVSSSTSFFPLRGKRIIRKENCQKAPNTKILFMNISYLFWECGIFLNV